MRDLLEELLAKHTGQPLERVHNDTDRDFVMEADEALAYGIIDSVIESRDVADRTGRDPLTVRDDGQTGRGDDERGEIR